MKVKFLKLFEMKLITIIIFDQNYSVQSFKSPLAVKMIFNSSRSIQSICGLEVSQEEFDLLDEKYQEPEIEEPPEPVEYKSPVKKKRSR